MQPSEALPVKRELEELRLAAFDCGSEIEIILILFQIIFRNITHVFMSCVVQEAHQSS